MPTLAAFQLYRGANKWYKSISFVYVSSC